MSYGNGDGDDWDDPDEDWEGDDDTPELLPCPHCGREIYEEAEQCVYCGEYVSRDTLPVHMKPWWLILGVAVCLWVILQWLIG